MERTFNFPGVKERTELPNGKFDFFVESLTEGRTRPKTDGTGSGNIACLKLQCRITAPASHANLTWTEMFMLGNEKDPDGFDPATQNDVGGYRSMKRLGRACGLDMDVPWPQGQFIQAVTGKEFTGHVQSKERKTQKGTFDSNIDRFYKKGEVPAGLDAPTASAAARTAAPATVAQPTAARPNGPIGPATTAAPLARPAAGGALLPAGFSIEE